MTKQRAPYWRCPRCDTPQAGKFPALSRHDNKTAICPQCGMAEAMEDAKLQPRYTGPRYWEEEHE